MTVKEVIRKKIESEGPITFRDFMDMALYYPDLGYYTCGRKKIGRDGDYYTSPVLSQLFSILLAKQMVEMWYQTGSKEFSIVEYGAGTGVMCNHILQYISGNRDFFNAVTYSIIEKSETRSDVIHYPEKVAWHKCIKEVSCETGCVVSNEVVDNFPVHRLVMADQLMEVHVTCGHDGELTECLLPASSGVANYFKNCNMTLPRDCRMEFSLSAMSWLQEIASVLKKGYVLTVDYGHADCGPDAGRNSLRCYKDNSVHDNPYIHIGDQDITCNVNFSSLHEWGNRFGLKTVGFTNQAYFLRALGLVEYIRQLEQNQKFSYSNYSQLYQVFTLLNDMGDKFKVLIQQKGMDTSKLSGLRFGLPL